MRNWLISIFIYVKYRIVLRFWHRTIKRRHATQKGENLAKYCAKVINSRGTYTPETLEETMFEKQIARFYEEEKPDDVTRIKAVSKMYLNLLPMLE